MCVCGRATIRLMPKLSSCFDVHLTAITFKKRKLDVKTTLVTTQIRRIISVCLVNNTIISKHTALFQRSTEIP